MLMRERSSTQKISFCQRSASLLFVISTVTPHLLKLCNWQLTIYLYLGSSFCLFVVYGIMRHPVTVAFKVLLTLFPVLFPRLLYVHFVGFSFPSDKQATGLHSILPMISLFVSFAQNVFLTFIHLK